VAFRQIDQDINNFKFSAFYFQESLSQTSTKNEGIFNNMAQSSGVINRVNKMKHDKQQMRKLTRLLLVWGKTFEVKKTKY